MCTWDLTLMVCTRCSAPMAAVIEAAVSGSAGSRIPRAWRRVWQRLLA